MMAGYKTLDMLTMEGFQSYLSWEASQAASVV